ncbi:MAG: MFS transporter [Phenylobacterium sp.]|uniref:MFS transporter n=1 Tax=Phenylobacterium sp. TaxID=1871053 RepID=UPI00272869B9|nr:MFS transporter [Phenylobacterium sp.]MDO8409941.1 MFS transporter [Phenylobacterium sp.]
MAQTDAAAPAPARQLKLSTILAFACTSLPLSALTIAMSVYLPRHFASEIGISLLAVGSAFALVRMIDIPLDPLLGMAMDRTRTRFGRYRLWTMIGAPILMLAIFMLFISPSGGVGGLIFWLLILYVGTSILHLSHAAWAATLAPRYNDRSRVFAIMTAVGVMGALLVLLMPFIVAALGMPESEGVPAMGWFVMILTPLAVWLVVSLTPEKISPDVPGQQKFQLKEYWRLIARPSMGRIVLADLCLSLGPGWMSALYLFFFTDSRGFTTSQASALLAVYIVAGFGGAPLLGRLAMRIGKHRAVMVATTGYAAALVALPFLPKGDMMIGAFQMFTAGFLAAGFQVLTRAMTADVADEVRLEQGKERSGLLYAITTLTSKISGAFAVFLTFTVLDRVGYNATDGAANSAEAVRGLELAFLIGPIFFVALGGLCFIGYKLGEERHSEIRRELDERDAFYDNAPVIETLASEPSIPTPLVEPRQS